MPQIGEANNKRGNKRADLNRNLQEIEDNSKRKQVRDKKNKGESNMLIYV